LDEEYHSEEFLIWAARAATAHKQEQAMFYEAVHGLNTFSISTAERMRYEKTSDLKRQPSAPALADLHVRPHLQIGTMNESA